MPELTPGSQWAARARWQAPLFGSMQGERRAFSGVTGTEPKADRPTPEAYAHAAWLLMVEPRAMRAIADVESRAEGAFLATGEPVVLFERHVFHRLTRGRFAVVVPELSDPIPGGYGASSSQHARLARAAAFDRSAALQACSWGLYQLMGANYAACGYPILQRFVNAMYRSADDHLRALVMFVRSDSRLVDALRAKDWLTFARTYNGPGFARNQYDQKIAAAYERLA